MQLCYLLLLSSSAFADMTPHSAETSDSAIYHPANGRVISEPRNDDPIYRSLRSITPPGSEERMMGPKELTGAQLSEALSLVSKIAETVGLEGVEAKTMLDLERVQQLDRIEQMVDNLREEFPLKTKRLHDRDVLDFDPYAESFTRRNRHFAKRHPLIPENDQFGTRSSFAGRTATHRITNRGHGRDIDILALLESATRKKRHNAVHDSWTLGNGHLVTPSLYDDREAEAIIIKSLSENSAEAESKLDQLIDHWKKTDKPLKAVIPLLIAVEDADFFSPTVTKLLKLFAERPSTSTADTDSLNMALFDHCGNSYERFRKALEAATEKYYLNDLIVAKSLRWLENRRKSEPEDLINLDKLRSIPKGHGGTRETF